MLEVHRTIEQRHRIVGASQVEICRSPIAERERTTAAVVGKTFVGVETAG
jgi:hypothetical protein